MRTRHTFLFTMLLGLGWAGFLFAYSGGPAEGGLGGVNGIFGAANTCNQVGCHSGNPLNAPGGTLTLTGLPSTWTPGQTYLLTVTVQKSGALLYGFQLSAVADSTTAQAGTLTKGKTSGTDASRISIIPAGGGIQYAEHNSINNSLAATSTFFVNWTAPASASTGAVRFNLAGNAANRDGNNTGDFIYTLVAKVSPGTATPPDFSLLASPSSQAVTAGAGTTFTTTLSPLNSFTGDVALSVTGVPSGATASFGPATITTSGNSTLTVTTGTGVAAGTYPLTITGVNGTTTHTASVSLTVNAPAGASVRPFVISNLGGNSSSTDGGGNLGVGYSIIQPNTGSTTPAGVEIIGYRSSDVLVSETGVPASPLLTSGRIYAEVNGSVNTGLAIANPNNQAANISFFFTDTNGTNSATNTTTIAANNQIAKFLSETPYSAGLGGSATFQGTFSFTSDQPVSVIALRGFNNERLPSDFLISTLPVIDTSVAANTGTQFIPHFAAGSGWTTQVILVNPGSAALTGTVQFFGQDGTAAQINVSSQLTSSVAYAVPARSSQKLVVSSSALVAGSVRIVPATSGGSAPTPLVVFSYKPGAITVSEAGAPANSGTAFRMYVESSGTSGQPGNISSGIAVANTTNVAANVTFQLTNLDGTTTGLSPASVSLALPASGQTAKFLSDLFPGLPQPFKGVLRISSATAVSVVGLRGRYNERTDFLITTTPPTNEASPASAAPQLFPHLVNGGGYTTQFILFSGTAGQISSGNLKFFNTDGTPLFLILN